MMSRLLEKETTMQSAKDLGYGLVSHPWKTLQHVFTCFSVLFTIIKVIVQFFPAFRIEGSRSLTLLAVISLGWGLNKVWKPSNISIRVANCNTTIEVIFGDLFKQKGIKAIAVSEFFDSKIGKPVSDMSLHGMFIKRCLGGHSETFDMQVAEQLKDTESTEIEKVEGKTRRYRIGATALLKINEDCYILFALTHADPKTLKTSSDVELMWHALHKLWQRARNECGGHPLNLPLVGGGLSGLGLPTGDLLNLLMLSAITETKASEITQTIRIVLHRSRFEDIDLRDVKQQWENK